MRQLRHVENALAVGTLLRHSAHDINYLLQRCGQTTLHALGVVNNEATANETNTQTLNFSTDRSSCLPRLHLSQDTAVTAQVIIYERPHPTRMQYLSLTPITLALGDKTHSAPADAAAEGEERERKRREKLVDKLKLHKVISRPYSGKELALPMLIEQVNCSYELNALLQKNIGKIGRRLKRALSVSEHVVESAKDLGDYLYNALESVAWVWIWPFLSQVFVSILMANRIAAEVTLRILHWRTPASPDAPALKDISATAQQLDIRLQQFCYWPIQYLALRKRKAGWGSITNSHPDYIRFYNSLWLVANDIILGVALGSYIVDNSALVVDHVEMLFTTWSVDGLRRMIIWLMTWPGGLKLNTELADFLGDLFLWVIDYWGGESTRSTAHYCALISYRYHELPSPTLALTCSSNRILGICWRYTAHLDVLGSRVVVDDAHLFLLHRIGAHFQLAAHNHDLALPPLPRKEAQCPPQPHRFV